MRKGHLAQRLLSLVLPSEPAGAIAGDLIETSDGHGGVWFWASIARIVAASVGRQLTHTPVQFAILAPVSWFAYMLVTLPLMALGALGSVVLWITAKVFTEHTGVELLTNWLQIRMDWEPALGLMRVVEFVMITIAAPFFTGRITARWWPHRELAAAIVMSLSWRLMSILVPWVGYRGEYLDFGPVLLTSLILGTIWSRLRQPSQPA